MSVEDGMVMQIHPGCWRNHNELLYRRFGRNIGGDMPMQGGFMGQLKPLLDRFGNNADFTLMLFTLDETTYSRELAPLAGHYPCLKLGPAWWFHDSPEGMMRYRRQTTESAGFYNPVCAQHPARESADRPESSRPRGYPQPRRSRRGGTDRH